MKKSFLGAVLSLGLLSAAHADVYKFDNTHTNAVFNIDHFQTSTNHGGFYAISGELKYQPEKASRRDARDDSRECLKYRGGCI